MWCDIIPCLCSALSVDGTAYVGKVAEEVETIEHTDEVAVEKAFG